MIRNTNRTQPPLSLCKSYSPRKRQRNEFKEETMVEQKGRFTVC